MAEALRIITSRDGIRGLRRGMLPRVLTVAPSTAISWMSYEFFSECLRAWRVAGTDGEFVALADSSQKCLFGKGVCCPRRDSRSESGVKATVDGEAWRVGGATLDHRRSVRRCRRTWAQTARGGGG